MGLVSVARERAFDEAGDVLERVIEIEELAERSAGEPRRDVGIGAEVVAERAVAARALRCAARERTPPDAPCRTLAPVRFTRSFFGFAIFQLFITVISLPALYLPAIPFVLTPFFIVDQDMPLVDAARAWRGPAPVHASSVRSLSPGCTDPASTPSDPTPPNPFSGAPAPTTAYSLLAAAEAVACLSTSGGPAIGAARTQTLRLRRCKCSSR